MNYRHLTAAEVSTLENARCTCSDWSRVMVGEGFDTAYVRDSDFSGDIRIGAFRREFAIAGGMKKHSGINRATLHNVEIEDDCLIENVYNYIANYHIGHDSFIENVDIIINDGLKSFGNGVEVCVLCETGGREVMIYDGLTAQIAYMMAMYRHKTGLIDKLREMVKAYADSQPRDMGVIADNVRIVDTGYLKDVKVGSWTRIEGCARLYNGTINSCAEAPSRVGVGVIGDDFIISTGSSVLDQVTLSRCFVGQACKLGHGYSASDSLFFANCQGENGEACAIFAGPFTVTHHKSTLLIAGMFSFMNAGSGSNQSNHMYKLGPIHQGIMERGAKTTSDSYVLWPARVGAFSLVMGRHVMHIDSSDLPFSYLIENSGMTYIVPGANLKSVGTIRDARKWPRRDARSNVGRLDNVNYNLLSPYTVQKMLAAMDILHELQRVSGTQSDLYTYQGGKIKRSALEKGLVYYGYALDKFLGNSLVSRIGKSDFNSIETLREALRPQCPSDGLGKWIDLAGMIAPKYMIESMIGDIKSGKIADLDGVAKALETIHSDYYDLEWNWAYDVIGKYYGIDLGNASIDQIKEIILKWKDSVVTLDNLLLSDASKEFSLSMMTGFGVDGSESSKEKDFVQVRGAGFDDDPFVLTLRDHIKEKSALAESTLEKLSFR